MKPIMIGGVWDTPRANEVHVYIGRGNRVKGKKIDQSPLRNPYFITAERPRERVIELYEQYLEEQIKTDNPMVINELERIAALVLEGKQVVLTCYCTGPNGGKCHGEIIKDVIERALNG